ncbi:hypothetical protein GUITHDRAFT_142938 [Guillardia theta CCMP2712]|uniref:Far11/STRP C-terminal domain-containing protein n=1 Tax=Guillardia theta (strain CCMP2712) TaxID=905079 RepID=L1IWK0_GUITC|nr:hypothetical protein GUITHDRAFT_142938 [Guillardia theta CCMP2712]EKX40215.1 hypothetical protein GUITHDRAFT_142938 [Guillardia theta CCMP2712]|eukprot:XP_005827195.1 hypothetical protein GUITHDRAFT_142938 [Guillardia theta CCMP2712]
MMRTLDIVLDEVDGGILDVSSSSDASCTPSPCHISIPRTPRLASSPSTPITPEHPLKRHLVEVLVHGFLRKPSSPSFQTAVAWFPAEAYELVKDSEDSSAFLRVRILDAYDSFFEWVPLSSVRIPADSSASPLKYGEDIEVGDKMCGRKVWFCARLNELQGTRGLRSLSSHQVVFWGNEHANNDAVTFQDVRKRSTQDPVNEVECLKLLRLNDSIQSNPSPISQPRFLGDGEQVPAKPETEMKSIFFHSDTSSATLDHVKKVKPLLEEVSELFCEREALFLHNFVLDGSEQGWKACFEKLSGKQVRHADLKSVRHFFSSCIEDLEQTDILKQSNAVKLLLVASLGLTALSTKMVVFLQTSLISRDIIVIVTSALTRCLCKLSEADDNLTSESECVEWRKLSSLLSNLLFVALSVLKNWVTKIHSEKRFPVPYKKILCIMEILLFLVTFSTNKLSDAKLSEMQTKYPDVIPKCISSAAISLHDKANTDPSREPPIANGRWNKAESKDLPYGRSHPDLSSKEARFYSSVLPSLPNLVVVLLKFLLASSVNTKEIEEDNVEISSPPVHDMASDVSFDSADLWDEIFSAMETDPQDLDPLVLTYEQILQNSGETMISLFNAEWTRYRRIVGKSTATCLRKIMRLFDRYLCLLLNDSNFLLLSLKMLNQVLCPSLAPISLHDVRSSGDGAAGLLDGRSRSLRRRVGGGDVRLAICMKTAFSSEEIDMAGVNDLLAGSFSLRGKETRPSVCVRNIANISCLLHVLHQTIAGSRSRIRTLVSFKAPLVLRKVLDIGNEQVELVVLRLYKEIACMLGRKWKSSNCRILSMIYKRIPPDLNGDYLAPDMVSQQDVEQEDDMNRKAVGRFNAFVMNAAHPEG